MTIMKDGNVEPKYTVSSIPFPYAIPAFVTPTSMIHILSTLASHLSSH